jgi:hypothetical protein
MRATVKRAQVASVAHERAAKARREEHEAIRRNIKKTGLLVLGCAITIAVAADILSIVAAGWIISWIIPFISWFMVRRINSIMKSSELIAKATNRLNREATIVRQRVLQVLPAEERARLALSEHVGAVSERAKTYVRTWIRDTIIAQLIELIPVVDILPLYLGQVIKMVINQNIEYQKVKKLMPAYERALAQVEGFERMEVEQLNRMLTVLLQGRALPGQNRDEAPEQPRTRIGQETNRVPARTIRDIRPAVALPAAA